MDLTEADDIKKRWEKYTELYKTDLRDPDNHEGVITHLEPDTLEREVKWTLGSITTDKISGGNGIPAELFQSPKRWSCQSVALNVPANLENSGMAMGFKKVSFHFSPKESQCQRMFKLTHNYTQLTH